MDFDYNSIGRQFTMRMDLRGLSGRDKLTLMNDLMEDLGLMEQIQLDPEGTAKFQEYWQACMNKHWR